MWKELIVSAINLQTKVAILEDDQVTEIFVEQTRDQGILGNLYKGRVTKVLPGMQAAFVDIGLGRDAFLYVSDFFEEYEEYEHLFAEVEDKVEQLLEKESQLDTLKGKEEKGPSRESTRERKKRRRKMEQTSPAGSSAKAPSPQSERKKAPPAEAPDAPLYPSQPLVESGEILVETFPISSSVDPKVRDLDKEEAQGPAPDILADRLETVAPFEPDEKRREPLDDQEARMEDKRDVHHLIAKRSESRNRQRKTSPKEKNGRASIGDLLREGQEILVQVAKEPISKKGARITSHVALPGRYLVFMPTVDHVGVSRKIVADGERQRLRDIIMKLRNDFGKGFIVRTAGENRSEQDFQLDMGYLTKLWTGIRSKAEKISAPALVHSELSLVQRVLRDHLSEEFRTVRTDDEEEYQRIVEFVNQISPELVNRVRLYNKDKPLFDEYGVNAEIEKALKQKVWLKNGGYIVIHQTEALVAIDVNTGKFVGRTHSLEDTITKANLDAVKEIVHQIRLRNLGGIIVIDFIDMEERRNRQKVMDLLQLELSRDKAPSKVLPFNEFGLVAITRKRAWQSLEKILYQPCSYCDGAGMIKSVRSVCYAIQQEVRTMVPHLGNGQEILIRCHPDVGKALRDGERPVLLEIEGMSKRLISIKPDPLMHIEQFNLVEL